MKVRYVVSGEMVIVRLSVPGTLQYRHVMLRVVASVCRLLRCGAGAPEPSNADQVEDFDDKVVSAVGEAFNNIAIHAYGEAPGETQLELELEGNELTVRLLDTGKGFSLSAERERRFGAPRESHMGIEIMVSSMDAVSYTRGGDARPNVLTMTKRYVASARVPCPPD